MRLGLDVSQHQLEWPELLRRVRFAEVAGFDRAWVFDHFKPLYGDRHGPCLEGWTLLAAMAAPSSSRIPRSGSAPVVSAVPSLSSLGTPTSGIRSDRSRCSNARPRCSSERPRLRDGTLTRSSGPPTFPSRNRGTRSAGERTPSERSDSPILW